MVTGKRPQKVCLKQKCRTLAWCLHFQKSLASYRTLLKNKAHTHQTPQKAWGGNSYALLQLNTRIRFVLCFIMKFQVHDVGCSDVKCVIFVFNLLSFFINVNKSITQSKVLLCLCAYKSLSPMPLLSLSAFTPL